MKRLSKTLSKIKYVLNDAEEKQVTHEEIRDWLRELKDVAYAAEDVLEEWEFQDQQLASRKVTDSLKELMESFDELAKESGQLDLQKGVVDKGVKIPHGRKTGSFLTEPEVYGRDKDKKRLVSLLLAQYRPRTMHPRSQRPLLNDVNSQEDIFVCSILGMGGLGKTTLAQMVYNDKQVADHFQVKSWVCVSDDFNVTRLIKAIIVSVSRNGCDFEDLDPLQKRLQEELNGKRFLVVLDDVWNDNQDEWNNLKGLLRCGKEGSCVIVTTRLENVASITGTIPPYRLHPLKENHCWCLFKQYAFGLGNKERPALVEIGKEIVARCRGLPLAAKALGGLLRFQNEENQWLSVKESKIWELPQNSENNILSVLELSYNNLPPALKQCFVYCSIFPKDHEINRNELIQLWMANGFIQSKGRMELEDVGNEIFHALLWRCFFQDVKKYEGRSIITCKMHDYVHDLASYIAADECSIVDATSAGDMSGRTRHLSQFSWQRQSFSILGSIQRSSSCLRSLISVAVTKEESLFIFSSLMHIRALELCSSQIDVVPDCIGKMIHLRYLKLSYPLVESLPDSMCSLRNLQTLKLKWCQKLRSLPKDMRNMSSLRHLDIRECNGLTSTPAMIGELTCLRTLSIFIVGLENGCSIKELQGLNHLGGELTIEKLENVKNSVESSEANLMSKKNLHSLTLLWSRGLEEVQENVIEVIEGLQPHSNLRSCFVGDYQGVNFPGWMTVSALPNLVEITLSECRRCVSLPPLGKLPLLKKLNMYSMDSVKFIDGEVYGEGEGKGFPSLEDVRLSSMPNLEGWSSSVEAASASTQQLLLPCLKILRLLGCPKMKGPIPLSSSLLRIEMFKCNETILGYVRDLPCLSTVFIEEFDKLVSFPEGALQNLTSLDKLKIRGCKKLKALPVEVENLTTLGEGVSLRSLLSLKNLTISRCPILKRLPKLDKTCLEELCISDCPELEYIEKGFGDLVVLKSLTLENVSKLRGCFPVALKHAKMLETLIIIGCCSKEEENEMDLPEWIGTLTSLQWLRIHGCKNRKVLPKGLQNLTALKSLSICGCHEELERRCEKDKGEDWFKIAHVPKVYITSQPYGSMNFELKQMHFRFQIYFR